MRALISQRNVGWYAFLVCFPLSWIYLRDIVLILAPYRLGDTASLSAGYFLPLMIVAVAAAWEGGRVAADSVATPSAVRSPIMIAGVSVLPALVTTVLSHLLVTSIVIGDAGVTPPFPSPILYGAFVALAAGFAMLSWAVGYIASSVIAAPLMAVIVYGLAIGSSIVDRPEYRIILADRSGCCGLDQQVDRIAIVAPYFVAGGLIFVAVGFLYGFWLRSDVAAVVGLVIGSVALIGSFMLPRLMSDPWATVARTTDDLACQTSTSVQYCVWPEQQDDTRLLIEVGDRTFAVWDAVGVVSPPQRVSMEATSSGIGAVVPVAFPPRPSDPYVVLALAIGVLPDPSACAGYTNASVRYPELLVWLMLAGGVDPDDPAFIALVPGGNAVEIAREVRAEPLDAQRDWFLEGLGSITACTPE